MSSPLASSSPELQHSPVLASFSSSATPATPTAPTATISTAAAAAAARSRKDRPCDACRRRKTRCVTSDASAVCGFCKLHSKQCTYLEKPLPRKRKNRDNLAALEGRKAHIPRADSGFSSRPSTSYKSDLAGIRTEHALLTPVSDTNLDWWPRRGDFTDHQDNIDPAELACLPLNDLFPDVRLQSPVLEMAWQVPRQLAGNAETDDQARTLQDTWTALLKRQASTSAQDLAPDSLAAIFDVASIAQINEPWVDVDDPDSAIVFQQMSKLSEILERFLDVFPTAMPTLTDPLSDPTRDALSRAKPVQIALKEWFTGLPQQLKMDFSISQEAGACAKASLHLCYYALEVHLHTHIISSISPVTTSSELVGICRHAAKSRLLSAMDFVNRLRPSHLQSLSWHPPAAANFAAIGTFAYLLRRTAPDGDESRWYEQRLQEFRWTCGVSNRNATWLSPVVDMIDGLLDQTAF